jgi:enoyl-CoA hydratase
VVVVSAMGKTTDGLISVARQVAPTPALREMDMLLSTGEQVTIALGFNAMDLILTGRGVHGEEALRMGLVNRVVPRGRSLDAAVRLAHELAGFPQRCLRSDRLSAYAECSLSYEEALRNELRRGIEVVESGETVAGATSFARGQGRHGVF